MLYSGKFKATLDACVLYPAPVRDLLLRLAEAGLYKPFWTDQINDEWIINLLRNRIDLNEKSLRGAVSAMNEAFPDANVINYASLINSLTLPDENDRHVLAAAIRSNSNVIVTLNHKDFPAETISVYDIETQTADVFMANLFDLNSETAIKAFKNQVNSLKNPPQTSLQVIQVLEKTGLKKTTSKLKELLTL